MLETILVIDDDTDARQSMAFTLESRDYLVFSAGGEDTAIIMARRANPRLIFINPAVAGGKGLEICKKIHGMEQTKNVPIIVLSAFEGAKDPHFTSLYGIVDSLQKPFTPKDLFAKVKDALSLTPSDIQPVVDVETAEGKTPEDTVKVPETTHEGEEQSSPNVNPTDHEPEKEPLLEHEKSPAPKTIIRNTGIKTRLPAGLIAAVAIIVLGAVGFMFYSKGTLLETKVQKKALTAKSDRPPQRAAQVSLPPVAQKQQADVKNEASAKPEASVASPAAPNSPKPLPKPETPAAPPAASKAVKSKVADAPVHRQKAAPKETGKTVYSVQVGVFKSRKNAWAIAKRYEQKGYEAFMHKTSAGDNRILYRVLIGRFASKREATGWATKIGAEEHITTTVFKR